MHGISQMVRRGSVLTVTAVLALVVALLLAPVSAWAQASPQSNAASRTITVVGEGTIPVEPDIARATIGVDVLQDSVREASAENRAAVEAVMQALQQQGIAHEDMQTSGFSVFAERYGPEGPLDEEETRYRVTNSVSVTIRELERVGTVLDAAVEAGANNIYGVEFNLEDTDTVEAEARRLAVADAAEKAAQLADYAQVPLGELLTISQVVGGAGVYLGVSGQFAAGLGGGGGGTPITPGQIQVTELVQVTYAIGE